MFSKYHRFFALRDEYPEHRQLLSELMKSAFQNNDSFSQTTYLNGTFKEENVNLIFEKLNLPLPERVIPTNIRSMDITILYLSEDVQLLP